MQKTLTLFAVLSCGSLLAQTMIDLGRQTRNVDFSNSTSTKTFKTGANLPATCSQGETYLKVDAPSGQNIYACTSANVWVPQGTDTLSAESFEWTRITTSQAQITQGSFRFGSKVTNLLTTASLTVQGTSSGTIWIYAVSAGSVVFGHNLGAGNLTVTGSGFNGDALTTGFPTGSLPLYQCAVTSGTLPVSCTDLRTPLSSGAVSAGSSGALSADCTPGHTCIVDIAPTVVPTLTAANTFNGLNTFSHLKLPAGASPDTQQCASAADAGKIWVQTSAASGRQLYVCEGTSGWRVQGDPVNISTTANLGYVSSVPIGTPLAAQTTVASANQIRLVLVPVTNPTRVARLAASIAVPSAGGNVRIGIYKADGTLLAQSGNLDTSAASVQGSAVTPVVLDPGFYYFAWSADNTTTRLAGSANNTLSGLFNQVAASPGQATCSQTMSAGGLPSTCGITALPDTDGFPVIAIAGFAQ